jgi:hypothetical protein
MKLFERDHYAEMFNSGLASGGASIEAREATIKKCNEILHRRKPRKKSM